MNRRSFIGVAGAAPALAAAPDKRTRYYRLDSYKLQAGTQLPRLHEHLRNTLSNGPTLVLEALIAPHMPQVLVMNGFNSLDELHTAHTKMTTDPGGPDPGFDTLDTTLLEAAPYSPEITTSPAGAKPRVFELRVYHSPTYRQLGALHDRFSGPEIKIFHRTGIHPVLYSSTMIGQNMPNLTYLIPFESLAHRETAWAAFGADPEWIKVRKESIDKNGQISSIQNISLWKATDYSPIR